MKPGAARNESDEVGREAPLPAAAPGERTRRAEAAGAASFRRPDYTCNERLMFRRSSFVTLSNVPIF